MRTDRLPTSEQLPHGSNREAAEKNAEKKTHARREHSVSENQLDRPGPGLLLSAAKILLQWSRVYVTFDGSYAVSASKHFS